MTDKQTRRPRMSAEERKTSLLIAGVCVAARTSYQNLDLQLVADTAGSSRPRVLQLFDGTVEFREAVLHFAVTSPFLALPSEPYWTSSCLAVIAQGIVSRHPLCSDLDEKTKADALATLAA